MKFKNLVMIIALGICGIIQADVNPATLFGDSMVLQQKAVQDERGLFC